MLNDYYLTSKSILEESSLKIPEPTFFIIKRRQLSESRLGGTTSVLFQRVHGSVRSSAADSFEPIAGLKILFEIWQTR